ncbi:MAG: hypothetical protein K6A23_13895 [Butyrivibrio sp.]|nr:hypothetical protein [Butyrivibrio sp.]
MEVHKVGICKNCKIAFVDGEKMCTNCGNSLIQTRLSSIYWGKCDDEQRKKHIEEYTSDIIKEEEHTESDVSKSTTNNNGMIHSPFGYALKSFAIFVMGICAIASFIVGVELGAGAGVGMFFGSLLIGMIAYGIGEICTLLAKINDKLSCLNK